MTCTCNKTDGSCVSCLIRIKYPTSAVARIGRGERVTIRANPPAPIRRVCIYEGEVIQESPCGCAAKAVRWCKYEGHESDRCTRGVNNGSVASCYNCPHHTPI